MSLKTIIIDDEPFVRKDLYQMLSVFQEIEVACQAGSLSDAKKKLSAFRYDLVFLDVRLPGGSGFDLLPYIKSPSQVVFITGHSDYAVDAFEANALDYLVKPVSPERLSNTIRRLASQTIPPLSTEHATNRIPVKTDTGLVYLDPDTIEAVSSLGGNYLEVYLAGRDRVLCRKTLKKWEAQLPDTLLRIHRSTLVNPGFVHRIERRRKDGFWVCMSRGMRFRVSRRLVPGLRRQLDEREGIG